MPVHANSGPSNHGCDRRFPTHARHPRFACRSDGSTARFASNLQAVATDDASSHRLTVGVSLPEKSGRAGCGRLAKVDSVPAMSVSRAVCVCSRRRNKRCSPVWTAEAEAIPLCCLRITGPDGIYGLVVLRMPGVPQAGQRNAQ